jgi:hypothetical protein
VGIITGADITMAVDIITAAVDIITAVTMGGITIMAGDKAAEIERW